ncbi:MAG: hypothetical protein ACM3ZT_09765 [Bacillota bacterium]
MRISSVPFRRGLAAACLALLGAGGAQAAHIYIPFSDESLTTGNTYTGLWLADTGNLGNPPIQLTNQPLDGVVNANIAILNDWTLNTTTHLATNVQPQLVVYGVGGHLFKADLHAINPVTQFTTGSYAELCSLLSLDERPFAANRAYVQAVVEPVGSVNTCASGVGIQTWLIPANATAATAPTIEPTNWSVLGAFTNPTDGSFVRWIVWTGNEVDAYTSNFANRSTLLVGPPTGPAPTLIGRVDGNAFISSGADVAGTHTDTIYHLSMAGSGFIGSFSYADGSVCSNGATTTGIVTSSMADAGAGILTFTEPTSAGYAVYSVPLAGGAVSQIYGDSSGNECGTIGGDAPSASHVALNEVNLTTGEQHVIGLNEAGPVGQTPVFLAGGAGFNAFLHYTVDGHLWIDVRGDMSPSFSETVIDGDGTPIQTYANSIIGNDVWGGFSASGTTPGVQRNLVILFSPNGAMNSCTGGTLTAIDPAAFTTTLLSGLPADTCRAQVYGWLPAAVGYVREPAGNSPVESDPTSAKVYFLLGPDPNGLFLNVATLNGYPFF